MNIDFAIEQFCKFSVKFSIYIFLSFHVDFHYNLKRYKTLAMKNTFIQDQILTWI